MLAKPVWNLPAPCQVAPADILVVRAAIWRGKGRTAVLLGAKTGRLLDENMPLSLSGASIPTHHGLITLPCAMSWDCYCAICGGPFEQCQFRTIRKAKPADSQRQTTDAAGDSREHAGEPSSAGEYDSDDSDESEYGFGNDVYDEDIITADEARWTRTLSVLVGAVAQPHARHVP